MSRSRIIVPATLMLLATAGMAWSAPINASLSQNGSCKINATTSGCSNNPGPYITIDGEMKLSGVKAQIILTNNARFTHVASADVKADVVLIPAGETIRIAKQPSQGGVGGNPWIYLQFTDGKGADLGRPQRLGRCVQGLNPAGIDFRIPTSVAANLASGECENSGGPYITLDGELKMGGLCAKLILTNNAKFTHAAAADVVINVVLLEEGKSVTFHKQPSLGGAGGNPWIYVQFLGGSDEKLGSPILVGRCNQLD